MKLYKYRDFSAPKDEDYERLQSILEGCVFWCARPDTLNDPQEFVWFCNFEHTEATPSLLANLLVRLNGMSEESALSQAEAAITLGRLEAIARPIFDSIVSKCRAELGVVSFGVSPGNQCLWQRYGGGGAGVCVELEVPTHLLGTTLHHVHYLSAKSMHIDDLLHTFLNLPKSRAIFEIALLSKPLAWASEEEVRFISKVQGIGVRIEQSRISGLVLGASLSAPVRTKLKQLLGSFTNPPMLLPYEA